MVLKEKTPFPTESLSLQEAGTHLHIFTGEDQDGNPTQEQYLAMGQGVAESLTRSLAEEIEQSGFNPDIVIGVTRGGFDPGRKMADYLGDLQIVVITLASGYTPDGKRLPPEIIQGLPDIDETEEKLRKLGKLKPNQGIRKVLVVEEVIDKGDSVVKINKEIEEKWHLKRAHGQIKYAAIVAKDAGLQTGLVDHYHIRTNDWVIFPWERRESFINLFNIWKAYKNPLPDKDIRARFRELGYSEPDIDWFGKDLFRASRP